MRIDSRQAHQALKSLETHKADRNNVRGLAHRVRTGSFKPVYVKSLSATPSAADHCGPRGWSVGWCPKKIKFVAECPHTPLNTSLKRVKELRLSSPPCGDCDTEHCDDGGRREQLRHAAHGESPAACRRLMTFSGVGQLTARAFVATIDDPSRIGDSRDIGAYLGWFQNARSTTSAASRSAAPADADASIRGRNVVLTATRTGSNSRAGPSGSPSDLRCARPRSLRRVATRSSRARCWEMELSSYGLKPTYPRDRDRGAAVSGQCER